MYIPKNAAKIKKNCLMNFQQNINFKNIPHIAARRRAGGYSPPAVEFEKMTSYAVVLQNTLKYPALAIHTLYFNLKRHKTEKFSFAP